MTDEDRRRRDQVRVRRGELNGDDRIEAVADHSAQSRNACDASLCHSLSTPLFGWNQADLTCSPQMYGN